MKKIAIVTLATLAMLVVQGCKPSAPTLNLLVWEGYADPSFVKGFEAQCKCKVTASYMGSSDELVAKLKGGSAANFDVISPSSDVAHMIATSGLVAELDLAKIPSYGELFKKLTSLPIVKNDGKTYGVPFVWGPNPMLYDSTAMGKAPNSWSELWNSKWKGKISVWDDLSTLYMTAQVLGFDKPSPSQIYNLSDEQLEKVKSKLLELKPLIRKLWATGGELTNLFQNKEVVAAMGWPLMTRQLKKAGMKVEETIPKESTTGWIDSLMITAASKQKELAHQFLEYMVQAKTQKAVVDVTGYVPANLKAGELMTAEERVSLHLNDAEAYMSKLNFWENVPRRDKYNEIWNEVKASQ